MKIIRPSGRPKKDDDSSASEKMADDSRAYGDKITADTPNDARELKSKSWQSKSKKKRSSSFGKPSRYAKRDPKSPIDAEASAEEVFEFDTKNLQAMPKEEIFEGPSKGKTRRRSELQAEKASESLELISNQADQKFVDMFARGLRLLSMREHSVEELTKKLFDKTEAATRAKDLKEAENPKEADGSHSDEGSGTYEGSGNVEGSDSAEGSAKADVSHTIHAVIDDLIEKKYLSDERFTEVYIRSRALRGFGPVKIKAELKSKGVSNHLIQDYLDEASAVWFDNAQSQYQKKYGEAPISDYNAWTKRARFMQSRGFTMEHIHVTVPRVEFD